MFPVNATKDDSVTVSVDTDTKDIDEIIGKLAPTLEYSSPDGFTGLLSLAISSIAIEAADETEADPGAEIDTRTSDGSIVDSPVIGSSYHTTVAYRGTLINLTPFAGKAATGNFILILSRNVAKRFYDKPITINYGGKSLRHIVQYNGGEYNIEVSF